MFLVDKPYVSDFFKNTVKDNSIPVVATAVSKRCNLFEGTELLSEEKAVEKAGSFENLIIYTTSENSIEWISKHLASTGLPEKIELFKNKVKFRRLIRSLFPDFYFKEVNLNDLNKISFGELPLPFIIKPAVGFFSMGVYKVSNVEEWHTTVESINAEMKQVENLYPEEVLDGSSFIIEECINGEEYAVDAYFNAEGEPVILGILKHTFASDDDVSDRVYTTSKNIIESNLEEFTGFLSALGTLAGVKKFPVHIELRRNEKGRILPIEVNPMRFGGWCTTADLTFHAFGFNPYLYFYLQKKPAWKNVLEGKEGILFSIVVLDNSTGVDGEKITSFNYDMLLDQFEKPLELRKIDFKEYPVFGFLFAETREENFAELKRILDSDLKGFITVG